MCGVSSDSPQPKARQATQKTSQRHPGALFLLRLAVFWQAFYAQTPRRRLLLVVKERLLAEDSYMITMWIICYGVIKNKISSQYLSRQNFDNIRDISRYLKISKAITVFQNLDQRI